MLGVAVAPADGIEVSLLRILGRLTKVVCEEIDPGQNNATTQEDSGHDARLEAHQERAAHLGETRHGLLPHH